MNQSGLVVAVMALALLASGAFAQSTPASPAKQHTEAALQGELDSLLERAVAGRQLPGVVAGLAGNQGTRYLGAAGNRNLETGAPMQADTIIAIASMTKAITTVATLQLAERGLVDLDAPVSTYLPELAGLQVLSGFAESGDVLLRAAPAVPTLRQLLTHTSGYVYEIWNENQLQAVQSGQVPSLFLGKQGLQAPLAFAPGQRWEYGIGLDWAGIVVERVTGKGLDAYFRQEIFGPLRMVDTGYVVPATRSERTATIYSRTGSGLQPIPAPAPLVLGGGGLYSTVPDYLRFLRALLNNGALDGQRILEPATVDAMFDNQIGGLMVMPGESLMPAVSNSFDMGFGAAAKWGLGFLLHDVATAAGRPAGSASWAGLYNSYFWIDRENGLCAVVATQVLPFYDRAAVELLKDFESAVYRWPATTRETRPASPPREAP